MPRSGLRGAVGLSLSLFVLLDDQIADRRYRTLSLFFMGITAFLTTLVQGTTMGPVLQVLSIFLIHPFDTTIKSALLSESLCSAALQWACRSFRSPGSCNWGCQQGAMHG